MNRLSNEQREEIIYRLLYGEEILQIRGKLYKLINPTPKIRVLSNRIYNQTINQNRFGYWLKDVDCLNILVRNGLCTADIDHNLVEISKYIDDLKVDLYAAMFKSGELEQIRKNLKAVRSKQSSMLTIRHMLDYLTLKGYAEMVKRQFLICSTFYDYETDQRVWEDMDNIDSDMMDLIIAESVEHVIKIEDLREIARTDPWKGIWNVSCGKPFDIPIAHMNEDQRVIVLFSCMYDNAAKHPECPPDDVIDDDDLFDGWILTERRKREKEQMTRQVNDRLGASHESADEVFIVAQNAQDIRRIHSMNDVQATVVKKQRERQLQAAGQLVDAQFIDRKLEMQQEINQKFIDQVRRGN